MFRHPKATRCNTCETTFLKKSILEKVLFERKLVLAVAVQSFHVFAQASGKGQVGVGASHLREVHPA